MKLSILIVLPVSVALSLATTQVADARMPEPPPGMADHVERALAAEHAVSQSPTTEAQSSGVSARGAEIVSLSAGRVMAVRLPGSTRRAHREGRLTLQTTVGRSFSTAVEELGDGSFRALVYLASDQAPRAYPFKLADGSRTSAHVDGGLMIRDHHGTVVGRFARPWARDADGKSVKTWFTANGPVVTQIIDVTPGTRFPVVADPWWIPILILGRILLGVITKHAARQAAARGVSHALIRQVIRNGARSRGNNNTTIYTQGKGSKRIRVIVDNRSGNVVTVTKG